MTQLRLSLLLDQSALYGLIITASTVDNIHLALKYFIEGTNTNPNCRLLSMFELSAPVPISVVHHLALLLYYAGHLSILDLSGSTTLLVNPKVMRIFCEALKHSTELQRLTLDSCDINDELLVILVHALTSGSRIRVLDLG